MKKLIFTGTATAIVTPFCDGNIDYPAFDRLLQRQLDAAVAAIVVTGTTGEACTLTRLEKAALWQHAVEYLGGRTAVIAGVGSNSTAEALDQATTAQDCGVDALLAVTPYYNKCSQSGLLRHYTLLADSVSLPLIVYHVPSRTGIDLRPETFAELSRHERICGIKDASGNISYTAKLLAACGRDCAVWCGNDDQAVASMALGAKGVISVLSNVRPQATVRMTDACLRGDFQTASEIQLRCLPLIEALFSEGNPIPVKAALAAMGLCREELRLPLTPLAAEKRNVLLARLLKCLEKS